MLAGIETFPNVNRGSAIVETALREGHGICIGARRQIGLQGEPHQTLWVCSHHLLLRFAIPHLLSGFVWFVSHQPFVWGLSLRACC